MKSTLVAPFFLGLGLAGIASHAVGAQAGKTELSPAVVAYLNFEAGEVERQTQLRAGGFQEIAPLLLPEGEFASQAPENHFGWPHGAMIGDAIVVPFRVIGANHSARIRSPDAGQTWEAPFFEEDPGVFVMGATASGKLVGAAVVDLLGTQFHGKQGPAGKRDTLAVITSVDQGKTWRKHYAAVATPDHLAATIIEHPRFGLITGGHFSTHSLIFLVSADEGKTWRRVEFPVSVPFPWQNHGTVVFGWDDALGVFVRNHGGSGYLKEWQHYAQFVPTNIGQAQRFEDLEWRGQRTNIYAWKMDAPDATYNPVTRRVEAVVTKRDAGFPDRDAGYMTLNLWSIAPAELLAGSANWRFEGTLLRSKGDKARDTAPRDGLHPAGTVIDTRRGMQHIFIYGGSGAHGISELHGKVNPQRGKVGLFRVSRTLDTAALRRRIGELDHYDRIFGIDEPFDSLERWTLSGSPTEVVALARTEPPRRQGLAPLPGGVVRTADGQLQLKTTAPGYYGVHQEKIIVTQNYRFETRVKVDRYASAGETLVVNVNYGARKFHLMLRLDGVYCLEGAGVGAARRIKEMTMDHNWHLWAVNMKDGVAEISLDGQLIGKGAAWENGAFGHRPVSIYVKSTAAADPAGVRVDFFNLKNSTDDETHAAVK